MQDTVGVQAGDISSVLGDKRKGHLNPSKLPSQVNDVGFFPMIPNTEVILRVNLALSR